MPPMPGAVPGTAGKPRPAIIPNLTQMMASGHQRFQAEDTGGRFRTISSGWRVLGRCEPGKAGAGRMERGQTRVPVMSTGHRARGCMDREQLCRAEQPGLAPTC